ncbi:hypothetical protein V1477_004110 [Vespula maculifrons]|uniref:Uncharacterized protein n=1 Tax=Vespula maculifrons TaxID=7453 RepID=A0ABD2CQM1_VESMC
MGRGGWFTGGFTGKRRRWLFVGGADKVGNKSKSLKDVAPKKGKSSGMVQWGWDGVMGEGEGHRGMAEEANIRNTDRPKQWLLVKVSACLRVNRVWQIDAIVEQQLELVCRKQYHGI